MYLNKIIVLFVLSIVSFVTKAEEPESKAEQCALYGSFQDDDGTWQVCESEDSVSESDS